MTSNGEQSDKLAMEDPPGPEKQTLPTVAEKTRNDHLRREETHGGTAAVAALL